MKIEIIEKYLENVLESRLREFKIEEEYIKKIKENIQIQIYSLIWHWNDTKFRKAILVVGMEEGFFYEPEADIDVKNFVVVTIRNSYIENIFSDECQTMGLEKPINENLIKVITKEAIEYFKDIDFKEISKQISQLKIEEDIYENIIKQFPLAWEALIQLGNCMGKKVIYTKKIKKEKIMTNNLNKMYVNSENVTNKNLKEVKSGISEELSLELVNLLKDMIKDKIGILYVDCFKMLTRNFKKLLFVIEVLLENEGALLTSNYLITNSYIGKRTNLLRAAHTTREVTRKIENKEFFCGLSKTHKEILEKYVNIMNY